MSTYNYQSGLGNSAAYQVSGKPFAQGSIDASAGTVTVTFPSVTSWVTITNSGTGDLQIGFSSRGIASQDNYLTIPPTSSIGPLDLKITALYLNGGQANNVSVMAGLTSIGVDNIDNTTLSPSAPHINWSGSSGVG